MTKVKVKDKLVKLKDTSEELPETKEMVKSFLIGEVVIADSNDLTRELYDKGRYGEPTESKKFQYSLIETLYLVERSKFEIFDNKNKIIDFDNFVKKAKKIEPNFWTRYAVFKDLRRRGYIVKTALKFGADFRVYDRGIKPGEDHAKWVVFPVSEGEVLTWYEFSAKNRVAHSTRKRLLVGCVDAESDVTYWEIKWLRP
ncbi:tRNA-intron lyase [Candidatus Woesearchaeota archaeon]|nr:tRNA-intron lyase [Candidatus Woesearchaeota archaeon]